MPCFHPIRAYQAREVSSSGKRSILFSKSAAANADPIELPCGRCLGCRISRSRDWALRCCHEATLHDSNSFLTLTYSDEHLPSNRGLNHSDFQKFMKRFRKYTGGDIRYYMCGEYGETTGRPHYHALIFGHDFQYDRVVVKNNRGNILYRSPTLDNLWGLGNAWIGAVTFQSAAYVSRYVMKKVLGSSDEAQARRLAQYSRVDVSTGEVFHVVPEYNRMSLKPGIGADWLDEFLPDVYPDDFIVYDGRKCRSPRFYDRVLEKRDPELLELVKAARKQRVVECSDNSSVRRAIKEKVLESRISRLKRGL